MKKTLTIIITIICLATMCVGLPACKGDSEADKAYDKWAKDTSPKVDAARTTLDTKGAEAQTTGDNQAVLDAVNEYLAVLNPAIEEFRAIDKDKLTGKRKDEYPGQLQQLEAGLQDAENTRTMFEQALGQGDGEGDNGGGEGEGDYDGGGEGEGDEGDEG